jgi:hypothetical protein
VLQAPDGLAALEPLLRYLVSTHRRLSVKKVGKLLEKAAGPRTREGIVTVLDEIELRGERRGERKGRVKSLLQLVEARFKAVPPDVAARIEAADEATLTRWTVRVLTAPTPEDVIDDSGEDAGRGGAPTRKPATRKRAQRAPGARRAS